MALSKPKIAVVMGGISREREVSLKSGKNVYSALNRLGYLVKAVDYQGDPTAFLKDVEDSDLVFNVLHGHFGEDGGIQFLMEAHNIPYTCSDPYTSAVCFDKLLTYRVLGSMMEIPKYLYLEEVAVPNDLELPTVLKPLIKSKESGIRRVIFVPFPTVESMKTLPPIDSMLVFTTSIPTPRPDMSETVLTVLNPGSKM